jgi:hypothetical protein
VISPRTKASDELITGNDCPADDETRKDAIRSLREFCLVFPYGSLRPLRVGARLATGLKSHILRLLKEEAICPMRHHAAGLQLRILGKYAENAGNHGAWPSRPSLLLARSTDTGLQPRAASFLGSAGFAGSRLRKCKETLADNRLRKQVIGYSGASRINLKCLG